MLTTILLGIVSSTIAEVVTALNKKLQGTVLKGEAAFIIAFVMAILAAALKEIMAPGFQLADLKNWQALTATFGEVFTISQVYFLFLVKKLNLDVQPITPAAPAATNAVTPTV